VRVVKGGVSRRDLLAGTVGLEGGFLRFLHFEWLVEVEGSGFMLGAVEVSLGLLDKISR
jgi:hypothetical protein